MSMKAYMVHQKTELVKTDLFQLKKRLLLMSFFIRFFLAGVEYSVVLPTALLYMQSLDAGTLFTGVTIAAYPAAAMLSLPLFGYLYDKTKRLKELLLLLNFFELFGNVLYALPYSKWLPACGRFISGLGDGFIALAVGEVTHLYPVSARLGILSLMELGRVMGLIIGPSFNFLIEGKTFYVKTWVLNNNTLPGVLMAFLWLLMELITICCVFNLAKEILECKTTETFCKPLLDKTNPLDEYQGEDEEEYKEEGQKTYDSRSDIYQEQLNDRKDLVESSRTSSISSTTTTTTTSSQSDQTSKTNKSTLTPISYLSSFKEIISFEFLIITFTDLILWFTQTNFEILAPYVAEFDYSWTPQITGMIYVIGGIEICFVFAFLYLAGVYLKINDAYYLIMSLIFTQIALSLLIYEEHLQNMKLRHGVFAAVCIFVFGSIPINLVCSKTLLTKLFRPELQGRIQGFSSSISRITMISGPLLSGYIFKDRTTYGAICSIVCFFTIIVFFAGLGKLKRRVKAIKKCMKNDNT